MVLIELIVYLTPDIPLLIDHIFWLHCWMFTDDLLALSFELWICFGRMMDLIRCVSPSLRVLLAVQKENGYTSLQDEAVKIFNSLQEMEAVSDPMPIVQGILQTCQDLRPLRDEVYCQLIKQTNHVPQPNCPANRAHWHLLSCMSCTFMPSRGILRYLRFHLKRCM